MTKPWQRLSSRETYRNPWMRVREDVVRLPGGQTTLYGVVETGTCVGVLPLLDDDHVVLVRQYRYVHQEAHRWEMPTGGVHPGESPEAAAQRELMEEAGYRAGKLEQTNTHYTNKSVALETAHLFVGRNLARASAPPDDTEDLEVAVFPFQQAVALAWRSEIRDAMTVMALLLEAVRRGMGPP